MILGNIIVEDQHKIPSALAFFLVPKYHPQIGGYCKIATNGKLALKGSPSGTCITLKIAESVRSIFQTINQINT